MIEKFLEVWQSISNQDFVYGLLQLESEIRADERKKMLEWMCHESVYDLLDEHGLNVDSAESIYGWNGKHYEADTINDVLTNYEEWLKGE